MIYKYEHLDWIKDIPTREYKNGEPIFLWGAGKIGHIVAHALHKRGIAFEAYVDISKDKQGREYCGHNVISPEELYAHHKDAIVIISCAFPAVMEEIKRHGIQEVHTPCGLLQEIDFEGFEDVLSLEYECRNVDQAMRNYALYYGMGPQINHLMFMITDACTLNCEHCCAYVPYHKKVIVDSLDTVINSYKIIMEVCQHVETVELFGGEPLTHPKLADMIRYILRDNRCDKVYIITNGTINLSDELIEVMKDPRIILRISDYGKLSCKKEKIEEICNREQITYEVTNYQYWDRVPLIRKDHGESLAELDQKYSECTANVLYVKSGRVFHCCVLAGLNGIDDEILPNYKENYVDVLNGDKKEIIYQLEKTIQHLRSRKHIDACRYCPGSHCIQWDEKVQVAGQAKGKLPIEKLYEDGERFN